MVKFSTLAKIETSNFLFYDLHHTLSLFALSRFSYVSVYFKVKKYHEIIRYVTIVTTTQTIGNQRTIARLVFEKLVCQKSCLPFCLTFSLSKTTRAK